MLAARRDYGARIGANTEFVSTCRLVRVSKKGYVDTRPLKLPPKFGMACGMACSKICRETNQRDRIQCTTDPNRIGHGAVKCAVMEPMKSEIGYAQRPALALCAAPHVRA